MTLFPRPLDPQSRPFEGLIGVAQIDVTPPVGIYARQWGAATHEVAEGVHRPFVASVLTLQTSSENAPLVLVGIDGTWWQQSSDEWQLRGGLLGALGLEPSQLIINPSHSHAGCSYCRDDADKAGGQFIGPYMDRLGELLEATIRRALAEAQPSILSWGTGWCNLAQNRDLADPDAPSDAPRRICGWNPTSPADGTVLVGRVTTLEGEIRGVVVNYACHPTTLAWQNRLLSPDWIGAMRETIERHTGAPCLFLQGASGELAPREQYTGEVEVADRHGRQLGFAVLSTLAAMLPPKQALHYAGVAESGAPLAMWEPAAQEADTTLQSRLVPTELELKPLPTTEAILAEMAACDDPVLTERLRRKARVRKTVGEGDSMAMPLWYWRVGEMLLMAGPHEAYSTLQTALRAAFAPHPVAVLNVANGSVGYLPPADLYQENIYQVWQSPFVAGSLERVIESARATCEELLKN